MSAGSGNGDGSSGNGDGASAGNGRRRKSLDDDFPLGDGTAQDSAEVVCPYCGEVVDMRLDPGSGPRQEYVEDCPVCCRPWQVSVRYHADGTADVTLAGEDEG